MGFAKNIVKTVTGGLLGGMDKPKAAPQQQVQAPAASTSQTASDAMNQEEEERRRRLLALNASGGNGQMTPAGGVQGSAPVTRKTLMGQ